MARSGAFIGLTVRHGKPQMARAVLEGVAFGLRDCFELLKTTGLTETPQLRLTGGGARSELWQQILADVLESEVVTVNTQEEGSFWSSFISCHDWRCI
jgi:xylulokinase